MFLSLASPNYRPTQSLRELFNRITCFWLRCFHPRKWQAHLSALVLPSAESTQIRLFLAPILWVQIKPGAPDSTWGAVCLLALRSPLWLQLEFTGHWFPSQASQQVVSCQQGHDVSGSMGGTANVRQDHWEEGEEREVRGWVKSLKAGPFVAKACQ